jgi:hypothetical protein
MQLQLHEELEIFHNFVQGIPSYFTTPRRTGATMKEKKKLSEAT